MSAMKNAAENNKAVTNQAAFRALVCELAAQCVAPVRGRRGDRAAREQAFRQARAGLETRVNQFRLRHRPEERGPGSRRPVRTNPHRFLKAA